MDTYGASKTLCLLLDQYSGRISDLCSGCVHPLPVAVNTHRHMSAADYFRDVPWFNLPPEKSGIILAEPLYPPLRLLGGSGKPSKLAALAAARKKKEADQKASLDQAPGTVSLLDRLSTKSNQSQQSKQQEHAPELEQSAQRAYPFRKRKSSSPPPIQESASQAQVVEAPKSYSAPAQDLRALPSIFASTMCGQSSPRQSTGEDAPRSTEELVPTLFGGDANLADTNPFAGPSPDDVVIQAQAKGSARS